jgi:small subunit ribosomal protein S5
MESMVAATENPEGAEKVEKPDKPDKPAKPERGKGGRGRGGGRGQRARDGGGDRGGRGGRDGERRQRGEGGREEVELTEKLVSINRVAKVVKGGRRFGFAALVVVGDGRGRVGHGAGKAREVPEAIRKATDQAKRAMVRVPLREGRTLHHDIIGRYGAGRVLLRAAPPGTGIIAGGPMRAIFEALGMHDVVGKSIGTSNPHNMIKATFKALGHMTSPRNVAQRRGKKVGDLIGNRREGAGEARE